jgi:Flp pilus assembly pilin Flp
MNKIKNFMNDKSGASNVEIIVWISVVLVIATILFLFRDSIMNFIGDATGKVDTFQVDAD